MKADRFRYRYPAEKLSTARRMLMLPNQEAEAISLAYHECEIGVLHLQSEDLDDDARRWLSSVRTIMDTTGIQDLNGRGTAKIKAEMLSIDEKADLCRGIDFLASWFNERFYN